jgi:hypothetical protein
MIKYASATALVFSSQKIIQQRSPISDNHRNSLGQNKSAIQHSPSDFLMALA